MTRIFAACAVAAATLALSPAFAQSTAGKLASSGSPLYASPHAPTIGGVTLSNPASIEPFLDGYVAAALADQYPPGMIVAVATRDAVFAKGYGVADIDTGEAATTDTLFRIASVSKTFVWTAVMMLVDEGKIDPAADVNLYLKSMQLPKAFGEPVTMNDLMAHRAGFEDTLGDFFESKSGRTYVEALKRHRPKRVAAPGERTSYSNWGTDLAALVVEEVSGLPFDEFVRRRILYPIGMRSTSMRDPKIIAGKALNDPALDDRLASPHKLDAGAPVTMAHDALEPLYPAGAVSMSANDAGRWIRFLLNDGVLDGTRLLSPEGFARLRQRNFTDRPLAPDFAHGFMETEIGGATTFGHGGTLAGFITDLTIAPSLGVGVFVSVNGAEGHRLPDLVSRAVIEAFADANHYPTRYAKEADAATIARAKSAAGTYVGARRVVSKFEKLTSVGSDISIVGRDDGTLVVSAGGAAQRYYPYAEDVWTNRSRDRLHVYRDDKGKAARVSFGMGANTALRVGFFGSSQGFFAAVGAVLVMTMLAFLSAWRRQGREVEATEAGRLHAMLHLVSAGLWLVFFGALAVALGGLGGLALSELQAIGWPPASLVAARVAAHVAALGAIASVAAVPAVMLRSGWSVWRKAHYALFAAAGFFGVWALVAWRVILSGATG